MDWTSYLTREMEAAYAAAEGLIDRVDDAQLDWKPTTGTNWMTTGQLLKHITEACGRWSHAFVTGEWGPPGEGGSEGDALPTAETMPSVRSVEEAKALLAHDKQQALASVRAAGEDALRERMLAAPWVPDEQRPLALHLSHMVEHLQAHKAQLFYYLKLQGQPVATGHLYGMGP